MEPLDPLDQLLRGRPAEPWWVRLQQSSVGRLPAIVAAVVVIGAVAIVLVFRSPASAPAVSFPRAGATPAGGTVAAATDPTTATGSSVVTANSAADHATTTSIGDHVVVHVAGAVNLPGLVTLPSGARVADAVAAAGGLRSDADDDRINLAAPLADGVRVFVPIAGQPDPAPAAAISGGMAGQATAGSASPVPSAPVDINAATADELDALPGVGPSTAAAIIAYRTEHRRFGSVDELQEVRGIGPAKFEALQSMVTVGP